jgi:hypothetical protein
MKKAPPRGWGFKPKMQSSEEEYNDDTGAESSNPGSAFINPVQQEKLEVQAPQALQAPAEITMGVPDATDESEIDSGDSSTQPKAR